MTDPNNTFVTPPGRIVGGSLSKPFDKPAKDGKPAYTEFVVTFALPKTEPTTAALIAQIKALGASAWANDPTKLAMPIFAWKITDGDSTVANTEGRVPNTREGWPGNEVVTLTSRFPFVTLGVDGKSQIDANSVLPGHWVQLLGNVVSNGGKHGHPGVFLNLKGAKFVRKDAEIQLGGGMSAAQVAGAFGGQAAPVAPAPQAAPVAPTLPATDIVASALAAPPPPAPVAPAPPAGPVMTAAAIQAGYTYEALKTAGWTDDAMRSGGWIQ